MTSVSCSELQLGWCQVASPDKLAHASKQLYYDREPGVKLRGSIGRWQSAPVPAAAPEAADEVVGEVFTLLRRNIAVGGSCCSASARLP